MTKEERDELLADEWLIVRHSGEIPEITYHSSFYYLCRDPDGPGLDLTESELNTLKDAAVQRYQEIILRDIRVENFHKTIYRGVRRSLYNWNRCEAFALRQSVASSSFQKVAAQALLIFLEQGISSLPENFINCSVDQLNELAAKFGLDPKQLPKGIDQFCLSQSQITEGE
ncbi:MAG: hypothetical protein KAR01_05975 [Desulfocapsa sp.]|nr:hypothetical protein [Desulfocapsa sp.]